VYVAPSYSSSRGRLIFATGNDALPALGPDAPPIPERCCAVCDGAPYDNVMHGLYADVFLREQLPCASFALTYLRDTTIHGWYCRFYNGTDVEPFASSGQGAEASVSYSRHALSVS